MVGSVKSGGSLLQKPLVRIPLKLFGGLVVLAIAVFVMGAIYNAFDEELTPEAKALLVPPAMGKTEDKNGYIAFLGMSAPPGTDQMEWGRKAALAFTAQAQPGFTQTPEWKEATKQHFKISKNRGTWCVPAKRACLSEAKADTESLVKRLTETENAELLARYRKVRDMQDFADLYVGGGGDANIPGFSPLHAGASLALTDIALKAAAGDLDAAVAELEREVAFHRRIIAGGQMLITTIVGSGMLANDLLTISELQRLAGGRLLPFNARLRELTRPQISAASVQPAFRQEAAAMLNAAKRSREDWRKHCGPECLLAGSLPTAEWLASYFIRPNETTNLMAAFMTNEMSITSVLPAEFDRKVAENQSKNVALLERPWYLAARNPVGTHEMGISWVDLSHYAASMNDLQALERMVDLQLALAASGSNDAAAFSASEAAKVLADPYTGKPFLFDAEKRLLSFAARAKGNWRSELQKRHGKVAIAL